VISVNHRDAIQRGTAMDRGTDDDGGGNQVLKIAVAASDDG
jgi:hypothetical protein